MINETRRRVLGSMAAMAAIGNVHAAGYPDRPITVLVPVPAGGTADFLIRTLSVRASQGLGQQVVMQYRPGASGSIAEQAIARSAPDGYSLVLCYTSHAINPASMASLPYDTLKDFAPVTLLGKVPLVLAASANVPASNVAELIAYGRANPGALTYGASGLGGAGHLGAELFALTAGFEMRTVPYKGGSEALIDLLAGRVSVMLDTYSVFEEHVASGKLKLLGVSTANRQPFVPDLPPIASTLPGFEAVAWWGLLAPAGTPADVIERLNAEYTASWKNAENHDRLVKRGWEPGAMDGRQFDAFIRSEILKWGDVVKKVGFRAAG
ncbi:tripartite tricarboxylate transporter substrate binding protein [soil metagenome]